MNSRAGDPPGARSAERGKRPDGLLTTGDMARITGNTLRTVRFYEEAGILRPDRRSAGGHRLFSKRELERLQFISDMRAAGLSLEEIRALLELKVKADSGPEAAEKALEALDGQIRALDEKLAVFTRLRADLEVARKVLRKCRQCDDDHVFPAGCDDCETIGDERHLPQTMRVLWALGSNGH